MQHAGRQTLRTLGARAGPDGLSAMSRARAPRRQADPQRQRDAGSCQALLVAPRRHEPRHRVLPAGRGAQRGRCNY